ncbi:MAG: type II toxin-antitoxin system HicB family antitoxin [Magnetococcus sp. DMHC-1]
MEIRYPAILTPEEGGYTLQFVDLEEAFTEGNTLDEVLFNATEVLSLTLIGRLEEGVAIPEASTHLQGVHMIAPDAKTQAALLMRLVRKERRIADMAHAVGTS